jgi:hypothetical protein
MKISIGIGGLRRPPKEDALSVLSELLRELRLSRLPIFRSSSRKRRRSGPVNLRCFSFLAALTGDGRAETGGDFDLLFRMVNFDIQDEEAGEIGFIEVSVEDDHLEESGYSTANVVQGSRRSVDSVLYIRATGLSGIAWPGVVGTRLGISETPNPSDEVGELW